MYQHKVQYYETDKMGITHHSNYIRWMEEARVDFLAETGYGYDRLEQEGVISPVTGVDCSYKKTSTFSDVISIDIWVEECNGVRLKLAYEMKNEKGETVALGHSAHCFLNEKGLPVRINKEYPEFYEILTRLMRLEKHS